MSSKPKIEIDKLSPNDIKILNKITTEAAYKIAFFTAIGVFTGIGLTRRKKTPFQPLSASFIIPCVTGFVFGEYRALGYFRQEMQQLPPDSDLRKLMEDLRVIKPAAISSNETNSNEISIESPIQKPTFNNDIYKDIDDDLEHAWNPKDKPNLKNEFQINYKKSIKKNAYGDEIVE